jgi:hypothetical protein
MDEAVTPPHTSDATLVERARRLLEELLSELPRDERPQPER